jgi:hypothetical protein
MANAPPSFVVMTLNSGLFGHLLRALGLLLAGRIQVVAVNPCRPALALFRERGHALAGARQVGGAHGDGLAVAVLEGRELGGVRLRVLLNGLRLLNRLRRFATLARRGPRLLGRRGRLSRLLCCYGLTSRDFRNRRLAPSGLA